MTEALRDTIEMFITLPNGITLTMIVRHSDIIGDLKVLISQTSRFDMRDTYPTYCSKIVDDRHTVGDYMVTRMSTLGTLMILRGGTPKSSHDEENPCDYELRE